MSGEGAAESAAAPDAAATPARAACTKKERPASFSWAVVTPVLAAKSARTGNAAATPDEVPSARCPDHEDDDANRRARSSEDDDESRFSAKDVRPPGKVESACLKYEYDTDRWSRFSEEDDDSRFSATDVKSEHDKITTFKEETDDESRFSQLDEDGDKELRFSRVTDHVGVKREPDDDSRFSGNFDPLKSAPDTPASVKVNEEPAFHELDKRNAKKNRRHSDPLRVSDRANVKRGPDEDSRFSEKPNWDDAAPDVPASVTIKEEPTFCDLEQREAKNSRKYGDRVLLARQSKRGMMKLGGGNQASHLYPNSRDERFARMGGRYCMAYNCRWNL